MTTTTTTLCDCCGEHPIWPAAAEHGWPHCEQCAQNPICDECGRDGCEPKPEWEPQVCDRCVERAAQQARLDDLVEQIRSAAEAAGWEVGERVANTNSVYLELCLDTAQRPEIITVRVSDHPANARSFDGHGYDYSLSVGDAGEAEHTVEQVLARLAR